MRISSAVVGIFGVIVLLILTGICSFVSYGFTRQAVVDMWEQGLQVDSPVKMVQALVNPGAFDIAATATPPGETSLRMPSATPIVVASSTVVTTITPSSSIVSPVATDAQITPEASATAGTLTLNNTQNIPLPEPDTVGEWSDPRQIRILLMGIDQRTDVEEDEKYFRTDTMILLNIDPVRKTAGVLSIPRDLWVDIPNIGQGRINQAHREGDVKQYPGGGGPALAMETIANNFGVRVDRFLVVNFDLFEKVIDIVAPEGVEVCPTERIYDPTYPDIASYGTIEIEFLPGCQRLKGMILLRYARTRKTEGGDFDRAKRQQEVIEATRKEVLSAGGITNFITRIPILWDELSDSYNTNMSLTDVIKLGRLLSEIPRDNIRYAVLDNHYVTFGKSPSGEDVLIPSWGAISSLVQNTLYPDTIPDTDVLASAYQQENAAIYVYNGTDVAGLANNTREWLLGRGVSIIDVGNVLNHNNQPSEIRVYASSIQKYEKTAAYLATLLDIGVETIKPGSDGLIAEGVMVVAGSDMSQKLNR